MTRLARRGLATAAAVLLAAAAHAAAPAPPERITYQGVLFDDQGQPRTGLVSLTARLFDAVSGGTLLYIQSFLAVPLSDGVFTLEVGPTGAATDTPVDPLTTSLAEALTGDLAATAPERFLEVTVGAAGPLTRTQILTVPYALRAAHADTAESATTAETAAEVGSISGLPPIVVEQLFAASNLDGTGPRNLEPGEGLDDVDGDGLPNYIDPDNDDDGLSDGQEVSQGSDLNVVTPTVSAVVPPLVNAFETTQVQVQGTNFDPAMAVEFGTLDFAPFDVTATTAEVLVSSPASGGVVDVRVTLPNSETGVKPAAFTFGPSQTHPVDSTEFTQLSFAVAGLSRLLVGGEQEYGVDTTPGGDTGITGVKPFPTEGGAATGWRGQLAVAFDPAGVLVGARCRALTGECALEVSRDSDGDYDLADETGVELERFVPTAFGLRRLLSPSLTFDAAGGVVLGYVRKTGNDEVAALAHDRDGDGLFTGPNERLDVQALDLAPDDSNLGEVAVAPGGGVAFAFYDGSAVRLADDRSGDGDFDDLVGGTPELATVAAVSGTPRCLGLGFSPSGVPAVVFGDGTNPPILARDLDGSGDFSGPAEIAVLPQGSGEACDASGGTMLAVSAGAFLYSDRNDDGDFDDSGETFDFGATASGTEHAEVALSAEGRALVATDTRIFFGPTP